MLAYIVPGLTQQTENAATDALFYLLRRYPVASQAFMTYVSNLGVHLPDNLHIDKQRGQGHAIPDLVGIDEDKQCVLMVELKFWATLTSNQPLTYLHHLAAEKKSMLLFVAPLSRFPTLWRELIHQCIKNSPSIDREIAQSPECYVAEVESGKLLGLVSWESLLTHLRKALENNGMIDGAYEVWQLQGLCDRLDAEGFHPLQAKDLQSSADLEIEKYHRLVDDIVKILIKKGHASTEEYSATPGTGFYKRYMTLHGYKNWCVECNQTYWSNFGSTPIWLTLYIRSKAQAKEKSNSIKEKSRNRVFVDKNYILIPLELALGVEQEYVINHLVRQIEDVIPFLGD